MASSIVPELPWVEKYRPEQLRQIVGQKNIASKLENYVKNKSHPNLLFSGPAGVGKTTSAIAMARELFGKNFDQNFLELNASVTSDTPVLVKTGRGVERTNFEELSKSYFSDDEQYVFPEGLQTLSFDRDNAVKFMHVSFVSRHKVSKIAKIRFEGGEVKTSLNHSVIVMDSYGNLASKECKDLKKGDLLLSFMQEIEASNPTEIDFEDYPVKIANELRSGVIPNPKIGIVLKQVEFDDDFAWLCGMYLAEGCTSFNKKGSSGVTIFTLAYPQEKNVAQKISTILKSKFSLPTKHLLGKSGFDRTRESSIQVRVFNTQLAKFFSQNFYALSSVKKAKTKRVPNFVFSAPLSQRISFLKGYLGGACGTWGKYVRYSSRSQENLVDVSWLARTCGLDTSLFKEELRIVWKLPSYSYVKYDLLPAEPFIQAFKREGINYYYFFRHALYGKKSRRISRKALLNFFETIPFEKRIRLSRLEQLANSGLYASLVKSVEIENYGDWVYDFSVPESQMFFGGTSPILLHNSDERGIDVVRNTIKDFARTLAFNSSFKIIFLDESDALTTDAQQALRRTMEKYTRTVRFILSCNYSSRIIEPIQSRCVVFRFRPLSSKEVELRLQEIAKLESLQIGENALQAIYYVCEGDMRKAVNILQASASVSKKISEETVFDIASRARPEEVKEMIKLALDANFLGARAKLETLLYEHGMSGEDVILQLYRETMALPEEELDSKKKIELVDVIGEYNFRVVEGANERIQLEALLAQFGRFKK